MSMLEWAILGAILLGAMIFSARIMRKGRPSLDEARSRCLSRIHDQELMLAEDRRNVPAEEEIGLMRSAMADLLRLEGEPAGWSLERSGRTLRLETPDGEWRVELVAGRPCKISGGSAARSPHTGSRWLLEGANVSEGHADAASLMRSLQAHMPGSGGCRGGDGGIEPEPAHLAARTRGIAQARKRRAPEKVSPELVRARLGGGCRGR